MPTVRCRPSHGSHSPSSSSSVRASSRRVRNVVRTTSSRAHGTRVAHRAANMHRASCVSTASHAVVPCLLVLACVLLTAFRPTLSLLHISVSLHGKSWPSPTDFHTFYVVHKLITHAGSPVHALKSVRPQPIARGPSHALTTNKTCHARENESPEKKEAVRVVLRLEETTSNTSAASTTSTAANVRTFAPMCAQRQPRQPPMCAHSHQCAHILPGPPMCAHFPPRPNVRTSMSGANVRTLARLSRLRMCAHFAAQMCAHSGAGLPDVRTFSPCASKCAHVEAVEVADVEVTSSHCNMPCTPRDGALDATHELALTETVDLPPAFARAAHDSTGAFAPQLRC